MEDKAIEEKFNQIFESKIKPKLGALENERLNIKKTSRSGLLIILLTIIACGITYFVAKNIIIYAIVIALIVICIAAGITGSLEKKFKLKLKTQLLPIIFSIFGNFQYETKEVIKLGDLKKYGLFEDSTYKKDDDIIIGNYKGLDITICETKIMHTEDANCGSNQTHSPISISFGGDVSRNDINKNQQQSIEIVDFEGLILKIKMNKNFTGHTLIRQLPLGATAVSNIAKSYTGENEQITEGINKIVNNKFVQMALNTKKIMDEQGIEIGPNGITKTFKDKKIPKGLEKVTLEDPEFNEIFEVYSNDQVESRYLLTPAFMERYKGINNVFATLNSNCVFKDGYLIITIDQQPQNNNPNINADINTVQQNYGYGFFEFGADIFGKNTLFDKYIYLAIFKQLISIFNFIIYFKLDQKTGI